MERYIHLLYNSIIKYFNGRDYMADSLLNVEIIMKEMLEIQQKSKMFVDLLSEGEALSQNQLILLLQLKINNGMKATEIADFLV